MKRFMLNYELDDKTITLEFDENIDFEKYNKTILDLYGKSIKRRFVIDTYTGEQMSMKKLRKLMSDL